MPTARTTLGPAVPLLLAVFVAAAAGAFAQQLGLPVNPATLPAQESHQGLLIAVRADATVERSRARFGKNSPFDGGILGLDVYFRNDNDMPIRLNLETIQLFIGEPGARKQKLDWIADEDVADLVLHKATRDPVQRRSPLPRLGGPPGKGKEWDQLYGLLHAAAFRSDIVGPHSTIHGYFYFDIDRKFSWLASARLDVPDLAFMPGDKALFFFQIDLAPALAP